jgi:hypothetical protein
VYKTYLESGVEKECNQEDWLASNLLGGRTPNERSKRVPSDEERDRQHSNLSSETKFSLEIGYDTSCSGMRLSRLGHCTMRCITYTELNLRKYC